MSTFQRSVSAWPAASEPAADIVDGALGRLARHVAHDVNNYLAAIVSRAELLGLDLPAGSQAAEDAAELLAAADELCGYLRRLSTIGSALDASDDEGTAAPRVTEVLQEISTSHAQPLSVHAAVDHATVRCSAVRLRQLLEPVIENAMEAHARAGCTAPVEVSAMCDPHDRNSIRFDIVDRGRGIATEIAPVLFEPLASTKRVRGAGLSLMQVRRLARAEGGRMHVAPAAPHGTQVTIWLPTADARSTAGVTPAYEG
ncbi:MAG: HAMP domain-containing histidine kinase [Gemmatimonadaceae bacterium]|jgi:signal transduction histidine kinase|nr:HAMP domain-containing histidine kinase [Gemmatimonadaceae bacterium]